MNRQILPFAHRVDLVHLEQIVERGLATFLEVGQALAEIRDRRLYQDEHATFEEYLAVRWNISRSRGYQLMAAAEVASLVSTTVDIPPPKSESIARGLRPLRNDPEAMLVAWQKALEMGNDNPTAKQVRDAVKVMFAAKAYLRHQQEGLDLLHQIVRIVERHEAALAADDEKNVLSVEDLVLVRDMGIAVNEIIQDRHAALVGAR